LCFIISLVAELVAVAKFALENNAFKVLVFPFDDFNEFVLTEESLDVPEVELFILLLAETVVVKELEFVEEAFAEFIATVETVLDALFVFEADACNELVVDVDAFNELVFEFEVVSALVFLLPFNAEFLLLFEFEFSEVIAFLFEFELVRVPFPVFKLQNAFESKQQRVKTRKVSLANFIYF
jgi:hypothetical protein